MELGKTIKKLRRERDMTQEALAEAPSFRASIDKLTPMPESGLCESPIHSLDRIAIMHR